MGFFDDDVLNDSWGFGSQETDEGFSYAPIVEERGIIGDLRTGALRGVSVMAESAWTAAELLPFGVGEAIDDADVAEGIAERRRQSEWMAQDMSEFQGEEGIVKRGAMGMMEALPSSVAPAAAGAAIGTAVLPGLGTLAGATIGAVGATLGFFGGSTGRTAYKEGIEQGMTEREATSYGFWKGATEGGMEAAAIGADILIPFSGKAVKGVRLGRKAAKEALEAEGKEATITAITKRAGELRKPQSIQETLSYMDFKTYGRNFRNIMISENATEQAQLEAGAYIDRQYGLEGEVTWEERAETIATTTWMSILFGGLGAGANASQRSNLRKRLVSEDAEIRDQAAGEFRELLNPELHEDFDEVWGDVKAKGTVFKIDQNISDRAKEVHEETLVDAAEQLGGLPEGITVTETIRNNQTQEDIISKPITESTEAVDEKLEEAIPEDLVKPREAGVSDGIPEGLEEAAAQPQATNEETEVAAQKVRTEAKAQVEAPAEGTPVPGATAQEATATPAATAAPAATQAAPVTRGVQRRRAPVQAAAPVATAAEPIATATPAEGTVARDTTPEPTVAPSTRMAQITEELKTVDPMSDRFDELSTEYMELNAQPEPATATVETRDLTPKETNELVNAQAEHAEILNDLQTLEPEELSTPEAKRDASRLLELTERIEELQEISGVTQEAEAVATAERAAMPEEPEPKETKPERAVSKKASLKWTRDAKNDMSHGQDSKGDKWFIIPKGRSRKALMKGEEELGIYKSDKAARAAAKEMFDAEPGALLIKKPGQTKFDGHVYKDGKKVNVTKLKKPFMAEQLMKELKANPKMAVGKRVTALNKLNTKAKLEESLKKPTATERAKAKSKMKERVKEAKAVEEKATATKKKVKKQAAAAKKAGVTKEEFAGAVKKKLKADEALPVAMRVAEGDGWFVLKKSNSSFDLYVDNKKAGNFKTQVAAKAAAAKREPQTDEDRTIRRSKAKGETKNLEAKHEEALRQVLERLDNETKPKTSVSYETDVSPRYKKHVDMFRQFLADMGIHAKDISVLNDDLAEALYEKQMETWGQERSNLTQRAVDRVTRTSNASVSYDPKFNTIELNIRESFLDKKSPEEVIEIFLHEAGHVVEKALFHQAPQATKDKIIKAYESFIKDELLASETDIGQIDINTLYDTLKASFYAANQKVDGASYGMLTDPMFKHFRYMTSFQEWFADNVSKWATTSEKPLGTVEKFFSDVANTLKKLVYVMTGKDVLKLPAKEIKEFLDGVHDRPDAINFKDAVDTDAINRTRALINRYSRDEALLDLPQFEEQQDRWETKQQLNQAMGQEVDREYTLAYDTDEMTEVPNPRPLLDPDDSVDATAPPKKQSTRKQRLEYWGTLNTRTAKFQREQERITDKFLSAGKKAFRSGIDIIGEYSPTVKRVVQKYIMTMQQKTADRMARVDRFANLWKGLDGVERTELTYILNNGYTDQLPAFYKEYPGAKQAVEEAQAVLAELKAEADANGLDFDGSVKGMYWPRIVRDQQGLQKILETDPKTWSMMQNEIKAEAKARGVKELTPDEKEQVITSFLNTGRYYGALGRAGATKARNIVHVTHQMVPFYENAATALTNHIQEMTEKIETAQFTGANKARVQLIKDLKKAENLQRLNKKPEAKKRYAAEVASLRDKLQNPENTEIIDESLDTTMRKLLESDTKVTGEQVDEMIQIVRARLQEKGMHGVIGTGRNLGLMSTLTDMTSLVTQASEIVFSVFTGGKYLSTPWSGLGKAIRKESFIKGVDVGLKQALMEYQRDSDSKSTAWVSKLLDGVGFSTVDITMKETFMNTAILRAQKMSKAELKAEWGDFFGPDFEAFYSELQNNEVGQHTQLMAYSKLMDYQPTDVIANPQAYMEGGNWRIAYMLKTFQLRQANRVYSEAKRALKLAKAGDTKAAMEAGAKLAGFIVLFSLAGATKDEIRDLILGRELPAREHFWNNMMQLGMMSRYDFQQMQKDGFGATLLGNLQPPTPFLDLPYKTAESFIKGEGVDWKVLSMFPVVGKPWYARAFEGGQATTLNQTKGGFSRRIEDAIMDDDRQALTGIRADIRKYNQGRTGDQRITSSYVARKISATRKKKREEARN